MVHEAELDELAASIKLRGIIQPIVVRALAGVPDTYEIVAGERRWRAAQRAGLHEAPIVVVEIDDRTSLEYAILENVQRSDLNAIEEAAGYERLMSEFRYSQTELAEIIGKSRSHLANTLRLLQLSSAIQDRVVAGEITAGHGRLPAPGGTSARGRHPRRTLSRRLGHARARRRLRGDPDPGARLPARRRPALRRGPWHGPGPGDGADHTRPGGIGDGSPAGIDRIRPVWPSACGPDSQTWVTPKKRGCCLGNPSGFRPDASGYSAVPHSSLAWAEVRFSLTLPSSTASIESMWRKWCRPCASGSVRVSLMRCPSR